MPYAITLRLDTASAATIEAICQALAADGIDSDRHHLAYPPHITLAIYPDDTAAKPLQRVFADVAARWRDLPLTLSGIGVFPGPPFVVWVAPVVTRHLLALHDSLSSALPNLPIHPHYQPDAWMPHVTLTGPLANAEPALAAILPHWRPISGMLVQADLVHFCPVKVLSSQTLAPDQKPSTKP